MLTGEEIEAWKEALTPDGPQEARQIGEAEREQWQAALAPAVRPPLSDAVRQRWLEALV